MKKLILSAGFVALCFASNAQSSKPVEVEGVDKPYAPKPESTHAAKVILTSVEQMPQYPGGQDAMMNFLRSEVRYPKEARDYNIQGRVIAKFVVDKDGSITNVTIVRGIGGGCDEETLRVIRAMPKWKPGYQKGEPVRVYFTLPISFKLGK